MHNTTITEIGPNNQQLPIGAVQAAAFNKSNSGPFWIDEVTKVSEKYDTSLEGTSAREKIKAQILIKL